mmetsp:Transcript_3828/g.9906  ORF Transcript_3828/g.9906 Transcript_3828/m.9906 type:complete len:246 (+) Transcript_3828:19-756(+)
MESKLEKSLDDLIKSSRKERTAAKKPANDKASQVKKRTQQLRAEKVNKARGMDVDSSGAKPKKVIVKPTIKGAKRPQKATAGRARPTNQGKSKIVVGKRKKGGAVASRPKVVPNVPPSGLIVQVNTSPARGGGARGGAGGGGARRGGRGGGRAGLVQPVPGRSTASGARRGGGGGAGGGRSRGIIKPGKPQGPTTTFGSATANAAARAVARSVGGGGGGGSKGKGGAAKGVIKPKAKGSARRGKK